MSGLCMKKRSRYPDSSCVVIGSQDVGSLDSSAAHVSSLLHAVTNNFIKGPYRPFCMFEPNIFTFHTCNVTDNHFPKDKIVFQLS
ncbi:hypothetical protein LDENG_00213160 [Lucifuga dentata]|nr:hypothetical protein LDENG_00213160 [Lucifuga dentata]